FVRESRLAAALEHPNVVPVHATGEHDGCLYIAMRYVEGTSLARLLAERGPLPAPLAVAIVEQTAAALDAAHAHGLVHRDVKPGNILLAGQEPFHVYLTDFGLAVSELAAPGLTTSGSWLGTLD